MWTRGLWAALLCGALGGSARADEAPPAAAPVGPEPVEAGAYLRAKAGALVPLHHDLEGFQTGPALDVAVGYRLGRHLAVEGSAGWSRSLFSQAWRVGTDPSAGTLEARTEVELTVLPVLASLVITAPLGALDLHALAGGGVCFFSQRSAGSFTGSPALTRTATSHPLGAHAGAGASVRLAPQFSLGLEARYLLSGPRLPGNVGRADSLLVQAALAFWP